MGNSCKNCDPPPEQDLQVIPNRLQHLYPADFHNPQSLLFAQKLGEFRYCYKFHEVPNESPERNEVVGPLEVEEGARYYG